MEPIDGGDEVGRKAALSLSVLADFSPDLLAQEAGIPLKFACHIYELYGSDIEAARDYLDAVWEVQRACQRIKAARYLERVMEDGAADVKARFSAASRLLTDDRSHKRTGGSSAIQDIAASLSAAAANGVSQD